MEFKAQDGPCKQPRIEPGSLQNFIATNFIVDKQLIIPKQKVEELIKQHRKQELAQALGHVIAAYHLPFPFKRTFINDLMPKFQALCSYYSRAGIRLYGGTYSIPGAKFWKDHLADTYCGVNCLDPDWQDRPTTVLFQSHVTEYEEMNILSDYYQEHVRLSAVAGAKNRSPLDHWTQPHLNQAWLLQMLDSPIDINSHTLREQMYLAKIKEASQFKATVSHLIIHLFGARRILDFCAGWGDRLVGALSCQEVIDYYCGVDPNPALMDGYIAMINQFAPPNGSTNPKYHMVCHPFEKCTTQLLYQEYDLVFTGPPYFTYERYTDAPGQSIDSYPDVVDWTIHFLFASVLKSWRMLVPGGHLALNFEDTAILGEKGIVFVQPLHLFVGAAIPDACYRGVISFSGARVRFGRPIWIWQKMVSNHSMSPPSTLAVQSDTCTADNQHGPLQHTSENKHIKHCGDGSVYPEPNHTVHPIDESELPEHSSSSRQQACQDLKRLFPALYDALLQHQDLLHIQLPEIGL